MIEVKSPSDNRRFRVMGLLETYETEVQKRNQYKHISFFRNPSLKNTSPIVQRLYQILNYCDKEKIDGNDFILAQFEEWEKLNKYYPTYPTVQYIGDNPGCIERYAIWVAKRGHPGVEIETVDAIYNRKLKNFLARRPDFTEEKIYDNPILLLWFPRSVVIKSPYFIERRQRGFFDGWAQYVLRNYLKENDESSSGATGRSA